MQPGNKSGEPVSPETYYHKKIREINESVFPNSHHRELVIRGRNFIEKHFSETLNLDQIASAAFLSKFHFARLFKSMYGRTPYQYLTSVRIGKARHALIDGASVAEVCSTVGFESISSFTGLFKKITGQSPAAFQQQFAKGKAKKQD